MNVFEATTKRRSIRAYLDKEVPESILTQIVEAGQWAPNAGPFQISVIRNRDLQQKINERAHRAMLGSEIEFLRQRASLPGYQPLYGAPVLILLSGPNGAHLNAFNAGLAAENMILTATALGLGSCYLISPNLALQGEGNRDLAQRAGIPNDFAFQCAVIVGYAAAENKFSLGERDKRGTINYVD